MDQLRTNVSACSLCTNDIDFFCHGCERLFCLSHANEHRRMLYDQLDWLTVDHDDLLDLLQHASSIQQTNDQSKKTIDKWEEETIRHVRKTADDARQALELAIERHMSEAKQRLEHFKTKIQTLANNQHLYFDERNLKEWSKELQNLKTDYITTPSFTVRIHGNKPVVMPIIKIQPQQVPPPVKHLPESTVNAFGLVPIRPSFTSKKQESQSDTFGRHSEHVKILDQGLNFQHDPTRNDASIRGTHEYSRGEHQLFFRIEQLTSSPWMFFGILSKHARFDQRAYQNPTAYGWTGYNRIFINGKSILTINGYLNDLKQNDFIELIIDCDRKQLIFWHSRQMYKTKLSIDIKLCPFPWQLLISCQNPDDSLQILPASMSSTIKQEQDKLHKNMIIKDNQYEIKTTSVKS